MTKAGNLNWRGERKGYVPGVFHVTDVENTFDGLRLRFTRWERSNLKPHGKQGSFFAKLGKERLPCLKLSFRNGMDGYFEPWHYDPSLPRNREYIEAIKRGRVLVAKYDEV
jgi:hypothetical protein